MIKKLRTNKWWSNIWPYFIFIMAALFILWAQKNNKAFFVGADSWFHINQFYESAMQIKTSHFSWFLTLFGFGKTGRIVNAVYGPIFSYLVGALLLYLGTWYRLQMVLSFSVLVASGALMYHLSRYIGIKRNISIILGLIYLSSFPITTFVNEQTFSGIGDAILPLIILFGIKMWKTHNINSIPLSILLAIILQIHLLTSVMAVIALIPFAIASFFKCNHKIIWITNLFKSILLFFVLTCNIWATLLEVFHGNNIIKPFPNNAMGTAEFSVGWFNGTISLLDNIYILIGIVVIALLITNWQLLNRNQRFIPLLSLLFLLLSSSYFPWTLISRKIPIISQTIQFPKRFLGIAVILLLLTLGKEINHLSEMTNNNKISSFIILALLVFIAFSSITGEESTVEGHVSDWKSKRVFVVNNSIFHPKMNLSKLRKSFTNTKNISQMPKYIVKSIPDYLPSNHKVTPKNYYNIHPYGKTMRELFKYNFVTYKSHKLNKQGRHIRWESVKPIKSQIHFKKSVTNGGLLIKWNQPRIMANQLTKVPVVKYRHTIVSLNHHIDNNVKIDKIGSIIIRPKRGLNVLTLHYQAPDIWHIAMIISLVSWLLLIFYLIFKLIK